MAGIVKIEYKIGGEDAVLRSFKTVLQAAQASGKEQVKASQRTASDVVRTAKRTGATIESIAAHTAKADEKAEKDRVRNAAKSAREKSRLVEKEGRETAAAMRKQMALGASINKAIEAENLRHHRNLEKQADFSAKQIQATQKKVDSEERRRLVQRQREERRGQRMSTAHDMARIDDINHRRGAIRSTVGDALKRGFGAGAGVIGAGASLVGGYLGTSTVLDAGRAQLDLGKRQALLQNASGDKTTDFIGLSKSISNVVGEDASSVMGGIEKIAAKSGAEGIAQSKDQLLELAKVAKGAGVSMEDLGDVTATLINRGIKSQDLVKNIEALVQQGKDGAVEFKDLATMLDASSGALLKFKMDSSGRSMTAGGLSQIARTFGKSSAAESTNAVVDLSRDLGGKADLIKKLSGVEVGVGGKVGRAQLRDVNALLPEIIAGMAKKGNTGKLEGMGGLFTGNSTAITNPLLQAFTLGIKKNDSGRFAIAGEGETASVKGIEAVRAMLKQFEAGGVEAGASAEAFGNVMKTQSEQTGLAMTKLKNDLGEKLLPVIAKASPQIVKLIGAFGEITAWAISNPFKAVAAVMAASMAKSLAGAGASSLLDKLLAKAIPSLAVTAGTVNVVGGAGAGGMGSLAGGAGGSPRMAGANLATGVGVVAAGAAGFMAGKALVDSVGSQVGAENNARQNLGILGLSQASEVSGGGGSATQRANAAATLAKLKDERSKGMFSRLGEGFIGGAKGIANGDFSAGNILSLAPQVAAARGIGNAILGGKTQSEDKTTDMAISSLEAALAKSSAPGVAATEANTAAINALPGAIANAVNLQGPKVPAP